jgi:hypothetical protein
MKRVVALAAALSFAATSVFAASTPEKKSKEKEVEKTETTGFFKPESSATAGSVVVEGRRIDYQTVAGTLVIHPKGWDDAAKKPDDSDKDKAKSDESAEASMFYVA